VKQDKAVSLHDVMTPHGNAERTEKRRVYKAFSKKYPRAKRGVSCLFKVWGSFRTLRPIIEKI
jgi:hypothetical protein